MMPSSGVGPQGSSSPQPTSDAPIFVRPLTGSARTPLALVSAIYSNVYMAAQLMRACDEIADQLLTEHHRDIGPALYDVGAALRSAEERIAAALTRLAATSPPQSPEENNG